MIHRIFTTLTIVIALLLTPGVMPAPSQAATVNTTLSSNTFTITATITNGGTANITYKEVGLANTIATFQFLLAHDQVNGGTGYVVSASGTLAVTYTGTFT